MEDDRYNAIMHASTSNDQKTLANLIGLHNKQRSANTNILTVKGTKYEGPEEILEGWTEYQTDLGSPLESPWFDDTHREAVDEDVQAIYEICNSRPVRPTPFTTAEVAKAITGLKTGKAPDSYGIAAEHLKYGGQSIVTTLHGLFNQILLTSEYPEAFKIGLISPIYKKGKKDTHNPDNYRKITISSIIGKVFEKLYIQRVKPLLMRKQSPLQYGFTENTSPMIAAIVTSEIISNAAQQKKPLYIAFLDTKKAFDVVWHNSLLRKLYLLGIEGNLWMIAHNMYKDMHARVKWEGLISKEFPVSQGLLQGGVGSPNFHKIYENDLFLKLEEQRVGCRIGSIYVGEVIVADDKMFASNNPHELQQAIHTASHYANKERYINGIDKSQIVTFNGNISDQANSWEMNGQAMTSTKCYTHIGIDRCAEDEPIGAKVVQKARRAAYHKMGSGLHGINGINPIVSLKIWNTYVLPCCLYGLEAIYIPAKDIKQMCKFEKKILKQLQTLPDNAADETPYILLGTLPINRHIDRRKLNVLGAITRKDNSVEHRLAERQMAMISTKSKSWFQSAESLTAKYDLPSTHDLLQNPPSKERWKMMVDQAIYSTTIRDLKSSIATKTSTRYLHVDGYEIGRPHPVWASAEGNTREVRKAMVKAQLLTGTYKLQASRAKINQHEISSCPLCKTEPETRSHFLIRCPQLQQTRAKHIAIIKQSIENRYGHDRWSYISDNDNTMTQLIIDPSGLGWLADNIHHIESLTRNLCYDLHNTRAALIVPGGPANYVRPSRRKDIRR